MECIWEITVETPDVPRQQFFGIVADVKSVHVELTNQ